MKTTIALLSGLTLVSSPLVSSVSAGDREWSTAGKVLTGVMAAHVIAHAFDAPRVYVAPQPVYVTPPPVYVQQPTYVQTPVVVQTQTVQTAPVQQVVQTIPSAPVAPAAPLAPAAPTVGTVTTTSYVVQQPVYVQQQPVYVAPPPVVYAAPYYYAPPVVSVGFGFGRWHHGPYFGFHGRSRGCW